MKNKLSIGVFCVNEEKNIAKLLSSLLNQKTKKIKIKEIIVVSSASTDNTDSIVKSFQKKDKRIRLITEKERKGKCSAINLFLRKMKGDIVMIESGDTIPYKDCVEELCKPLLEDKTLGLTSVRSRPINNKNTFLGYIAWYDWWWMSYHLARHGEVIAFKKNLFDQISSSMVLDEAYIEAIISKRGYEMKVIDTALISNQGALSVKDLIIQRKRNYIGHKLLIQEENYVVRSFDVLQIIKLTLEYLFRDFKIKHCFWLFFGACIELYSRILGFIDLKIKKKIPYVWKIIKR